MRAERRPTSTRPAGLRGEPGNGGGRQRLGISRLQAEHGYDVAGAVEDELAPDASGKAAISRPRQARRGAPQPEELRCARSAWSSGGLFAAVFFPHSRRRREREAREAAAWRLETS